MIDLSLSNTPQIVLHISNDMCKYIFYIWELGQIPAKIQLLDHKLFRLTRIQNFDLIINDQSSGFTINYILQLRATHSSFLGNRYIIAVYCIFL